MPKKDKYLTLSVIVFCGFGFAILSRYIAVKQSVDNGTANLIFILVVGVFILAYLLFMVAWEPLFEKFFGKWFTPKPRYRSNLPEGSELHSKIESFCRYSDEILSGYVSEDDLKILHIYIKQYAEGNMGDIPQKINTQGLDIFELCHYGWNIWNHFRITRQPETADWLINVFTLLKNSNRNIYKKFTHDERATYKIEMMSNIK